MTSRLPSLLRNLSVAAVLVAGLGACATMGDAQEQPGYVELLSRAESEVVAGRLPAALAGFDKASQADPMRKEPWVRIAQLQFDAGNYGRAIVAAQEVLRRDPTDKIADSVLTVAGLRIAAESLQRLQGNGALASTTARVEAERLAATMRATMGEDILKADEDEDQPRSQKRRRSTARRDPAPAKPKPAEPEASSNPFQLLGGD